MNARKCRQSRHSVAAFSMACNWNVTLFFLFATSFFYILIMLTKNNYIVFNNIFRDKGKSFKRFYEYILQKTFLFFSLCNIYGDSSSVFSSNGNDIAAKSSPIADKVFCFQIVTFRNPSICEACFTKRKRLWRFLVKNHFKSQKAHKKRRQTFFCSEKFLFLQQV